MYYNLLSLKNSATYKLSSIRRNLIRKIILIEKFLRCDQTKVAQLKEIMKENICNKRTTKNIYLLHFETSKITYQIIKIFKRHKTRKILKHII